MSTATTATTISSSPSSSMIMPKHLHESTTTNGIFWNTTNCNTAISVGKNDKFLNGPEPSEKQVYEDKTNINEFQSETKEKHDTDDSNSIANIGNVPSASSSATKMLQLQKARLEQMKLELESKKLALENAKLKQQRLHQEQQQQQQIQKETSTIDDSAITTTSIPSNNHLQSQPLSNQNHNDVTTSGENSHQSILQPIHALLEPGGLQNVRILPPSADIVNDRNAPSFASSTASAQVQIDETMYTNVDNESNPYDQHAIPFVHPLRDKIYFADITTLLDDCSIGSSDDEEDCDDFIFDKDIKCDNNKRIDNESDGPLPGTGTSNNCSSYSRSRIRAIDEHWSDELKEYYQTQVSNCLYYDSHGNYFNTNSNNFNSYHTYNDNMIMAGVYGQNYLPMSSSQPYMMESYPPHNYGMNLNGAAMPTRTASPIDSTPVTTATRPANRGRQRLSLSRVQELQQQRRRRSHQLAAYHNHQQHYQHQKQQQESGTNANDRGEQIQESASNKDSDRDSQSGPINAEGKPQSQSQHHHSNQSQKSNHNNKNKHQNSHHRNQNNSQRDGADGVQHSSSHQNNRNSMASASLSSVSKLQNPLLPLPTPRGGRQHTQHHKRRQSHSYPNAKATNNEEVKDINFHHNNSTHSLTTTTTNATTASDLSTSNMTHAKRQQKRGRQQQHGNSNSQDQQHIRKSNSNGSSNNNNHNKNQKRRAHPHPNGALMQQNHPTNQNQLPHNQQQPNSSEFQQLCRNKKRPKNCPSENNNSINHSDHSEGK